MVATSDYTFGWRLFLLAGLKRRLIVLRFDKKNRADGVGKTHWQRGFTLIEVVVSLALLAVMSMMAYQALVLVLETNQRSREALAEQSRLQRVWRVIGRDLWHLRNRQFYDGLGRIEPAYETDRSEFGVRFSRAGAPMLASNPSGLNRIYYQLDDDGQLVRTSWAITDSPRYQEGNRRIMLGNVDEVVFEHLTGDGTYSVDWPPIKGSAMTTLPRMIRVTITLEDGQQTSRLFPGVDVD